MRDAGDKNQTQDNALRGLANSLASLGGLVRTLQQQQAQLTAQQATLATTVSTLATQQAYLTSLKSRNSAVAYYENLSLTHDGNWHWVGPQTSVSLAIPTGKARIIVRSSNARAYPDGLVGYIRAGVSYAISGGVSSFGDSISYVSGSGTSAGDAPITHIGTVEMPPGTYTFTATRGYISYASSAGRYVNFANLALIVECVNND